MNRFDEMPCAVSQIRSFYAGANHSRRNGRIFWGRTGKARGLINLASLIANSIIIEYAVVSAKIELKSVTAQRITFVFSLIANDLAKCILKKDFYPKTFIENLTNLLPLLICPNRKHRPTSLEIVAMFDKI